MQTLHGGQRHDITRIRWSRHLHYHDRVSSEEIRARFRLGKLPHRGPYGNGDFDNSLLQVRPYTLRLAAADASGVVTVWNVATGDIKAELAAPGHKTVLGELKDAIYHDFLSLRSVQRCRSGH